MRLAVSLLVLLVLFVLVVALAVWGVADIAASDSITRGM